MAIEHLDRVEVLRRLCQAENKAGLFLSFEWAKGSPEDILLAAPYLKRRDCIQILADGVGYILGDPEEIAALYDQTVGDDGPTQQNLYNGPACVYALTMTPDGRPGMENT